jgi:hypothetical protein
MATKELIERFEDEQTEAWSGIAYDPDGPGLDECDCGALVQYMDDHDCYYVRAESAAAGRFEEMAYGID